MRDCRSIVKNSGSVGLLMLIADGLILQNMKQPIGFLGL